MLKRIASARFKGTPAWRRSIIADTTDDRRFKLVVECSFNSYAVLVVMMIKITTRDFVFYTLLKTVR